MGKPVVDGRHARRVGHGDTIMKDTVAITAVNGKVIRGGELIQEIVEQARQNGFLEIDGAD